MFIQDWIIQKYLRIISFYWLVNWTKFSYFIVENDTQKTHHFLKARRCQLFSQQTEYIWCLMKEKYKKLHAWCSLCTLFETETFFLNTRKLVLRHELLCNNLTHLISIIAKRLVVTFNLNDSHLSPCNEKESQCAIYVNFAQSLLVALDKKNQRKFLFFLFLRTLYLALLMFFTSNFACFLSIFSAKVEFQNKRLDQSFDSCDNLFYIISDLFFWHNLLLPSRGKSCHENGFWLGYGFWVRFPTLSLKWHEFHK